MKKIVTNINKNEYLENEQIKEIKDVDNQIVINNDVISTWLGMGGAITEASAYNYSILNSKEKNKLIKAYYGKNGLNYEMGRISIASNDFSLKSYEYLKGKDLTGFNIKYDKKYIIPMLKDIYKEKSIELIASPWSPPAFMKTNKNLLNGGSLKRKYYSLYSDYLLKFLDAYKKFNIKYLTIQNEPFAKQKWESCVYSLKSQKIFIKRYLMNKLTNTKILLWDHNRENLVIVVNKLYINNKNIAGVGVHWYSGEYFENIKNVHEKYPNLLLINTEMCCGFSKYNELEWLNDAELYIKDIIGCMNNGVSGYLDWNILLDYNGGPTHKNNFVKSAIILNEDKNSIIKTPIYNYLYHISHFIKKGSIILNTINDSDLYIVSSLYNNKLTIVIMNNTLNSKNFEIKYEDKIFKDKIESHSIITYII